MGHVFRAKGESACLLWGLTFHIILFMMCALTLCANCDGVSRMASIPLSCHKISLPCCQCVTTDDSSAVRNPLPPQRHGNNIHRIMWESIADWKTMLALDRDAHVKTTTLASTPNNDRGCIVQGISQILHRWSLQ